MRTVAASLAYKSGSAEDIIGSRGVEGLAIRDGLDQRFQRAEDAKLRERFLKTLYYPDAICGQKKIVDAHAATFRWVFEPPELTGQSWSDFAKWLETGSGTYWINGKAGSGKSTLMNYISYNPQTRQLLHTWAGAKGMLTPTFFFWFGGNRLQKSTEGFLRSILYQIFTQRRELIPTLSGKHASSLIWTEGHLRQCLLDVATENSDSLCICVFVDGLDECEDDHGDLLRLIEELTKLPNFKCCYSSRPERAFTIFEALCTLKLQNITRNDIRNFTDAKLGELSQMQQLPPEQVHWRDRLKETIAQKADGVFIWVDLVLRSQINGIRNQDSLEILQKKLDSLPADIEEIYSRILETIGKCYLKEAAKFLATAYYFSSEDPLSMFGTSRPHNLNFTIAAFGLTDDLHLASQFETSDIASRCSYVNNRINTTCLGLLEVYDFDEIADTREVVRPEVKWLAWKSERGPPSTTAVDWTRQGLRFLHRSAQDFLGPGGKGGDFLQSLKPFSVGSNLKLLGCAIHLCWMRLCELGDSHDYMTYHVRSLMQLASFWGMQAENTLVRPIRLLQYFDKTIADLDRFHNITTDGRHWCCRWGSCLNEPAVVRVPGFTIREIPFPVAYEPTDFLSFAAYMHVDWFVRGAMKEVQLSSRKAEEVAFCMTLRRVYKLVCCLFDTKHNAGKSFKFRSTTETETTLITKIRLADSVEDPTVGIAGTISTSIWEALVQALYTRRFESRSVLASIDFAAVECQDLQKREHAEVLEHLLEIYSKQNPVIFFDNISCFGMDGLTWGLPFSGFDLDMSLLPLSIAISGYEGRTDKVTQASLTPRRPLRLVFKEGTTLPDTTEDDSEITIYTMSDTEVAEMYSILRTILDTPVHCMSSRQSLCRNLFRWLRKLHRTHFPQNHNPQFWEKRSDDTYKCESEDSELGDDDERADDQNYGMNVTDEEEG